MDRLHEAIIFLKNAEKARENLGRAFDFDDVQVLCDGVACIALNQEGKLELNMRPAKAAPKLKGVTLYEAVKTANKQNGLGEAYISMRTLEAFIKERRSARREEYEKNPTKLLHQIDEDFIKRDHPLFEVIKGVYVDSVRLLRVMRLSGVRKQLFRIRAGETNRDPVGINGAYGEAFIMPVIKLH